MVGETDSQDNRSFDDFYQEMMQRKYGSNEDPRDLLNRSSDINDICRIIKQKAYDKDYFSLALTGEWGSGKSFVLSRVEKKLKGEFITIHYDCWENDFYDEPLYGLLYSLIQFFNSDDNPDLAQSKYYKAFKKIVLGVVRQTPLVDVVSKGFVSVASETIAVVKKVADKKSIDSNVEQFQKDIHSILDQISAAFATFIVLENRKIIIAVDELDRCLPAYALKVLNRLHHICYGASIILIIAVNKAELFGCVNNAFGKESDDNFSNRYLDRFFDYSYSLSNGQTSDLLCLWKGIDAFDDSIVSRDFLRDFCNTLLNDFSMREKKKLISNVCSFHKIATQDNHDKLTYAVLCAELMFAIKYFYLNDYHWDFLVGPFDSGPFDKDKLDMFYQPRPKENVYTLCLSKSIQFGNEKDVKIKLDNLVTEYDGSPFYDISIALTQDRIKALFTEQKHRNMKHERGFVCSSKDALFKKEFEVFKKFQKILQQNR